MFCVCLELAVPDQSFFPTNELQPKKAYPWTSGALQLQDNELWSWTKTQHCCNSYQVSDLTAQSGAIESISNASLCLIFVSFNSIAIEELIKFFFKPSTDLPLLFYFPLFLEVAFTLKTGLLSRAPYLFVDLSVFALLLSKSLQ